MCVFTVRFAADGAMEMSGIRLLQLTSATLRKDTYIPINPLENTDLFIIGPEDTEITVRFKYHCKIVKCLLYLF